MMVIKFGTLNFATDRARMIPVTEYAGGASYKVEDVARKSAMLT